MIKLIDAGRAKPSFVIDTEIGIDDAKKAYRDFADREIIKAVLRFDNPPSQSVEVEGDEKKTVNGAKHGASSPRKRRRET